MKITFIFLLACFGVNVYASEMQNEIDHVVILMLENRSFDNVLGWLYENNAPNKIVPSTNTTPFLGLSADTLDHYVNVLKNSAGEAVFSSAPIKGVPSTLESPYLNSPSRDPNEPYTNVMVQIYNNETTPTMTGFLQDFASLWDEKEWSTCQTDICGIMETYTSNELPILYGLAKHYAVSDLWFSSVPTQTNPNRAFFFCGTSCGEIVNGVLGKNDFKADTIWNRLVEESPETTWTIFWQGDMTPGLFPGPYSGPNLFSAFKKIPNYEDHFMKMDLFHQMARDGELPSISFLEPLWTISENIDEMEHQIYSQLINNNSVLGLQGNDFHPPGDVRTAENLIANIYTSLISNKETWERTLFIITFDEHGGLFDHVPPPAAIPPDHYDQNGFGFDRYGVRVPAIFISPKIDQGSVIRSDNPALPFDHTSYIATLLKWRKVDQAKWKLGKRTDQAPTFENIISANPPRTDCKFTDDPIDNANVVKLGDPFYLKDQNGQYLSPSGLFPKPIPLQFTGGSGNLMHGSFALIQKDGKVLGNDVLCLFGPNTHTPNQWWTVKSVDYPNLGREIQYGDKIYLETHIYLDILKFVPARLIQNLFFFQTYVDDQVSFRSRV